MAGVEMIVVETDTLRLSARWRSAAALTLVILIALVTRAVAQSPEAAPGETPPPDTTAPAPAAAVEGTPAPAPGATTEGAPPPTPSSTVEGTPPAAPAVDYGGDRAAAYRAFREHFAARRFAEALPAAQQVVDITEQKFGKESLELAKPLLNLGTTKHRLADFNGAAAQYQRALKIVETHEGGFSRGVIRPLLGLGVTYAAAGDYEASARSLRRAVDVSRKLDGLFNPEQLELVEPLVASYVELGQYEEAEREQQYAVRLAEARYGKDDPRLIPTLEYNASWLERTGRYIAARQSYARALDIARKAGGKQDLRMVTPLRGIARMYRLEYLYGPGYVEADEPVANPSGSTGFYGAPTPGSTPTTTVLNEAGENALQLALEVLDAHPEEAIAIRGDTLVDLGDWYMVAGRTRDATREYRNAWVALSAPGAAGTAILGAPVQLIYRPPSGARRNPTVDPEEYQEHFVDIELTVTPEGRAADASVVAGDVTEATGKTVVAAIRRARYRPRFVDGEPVATGGVRHHQVIYVRSRSTT
jgi:tetratricopeptide (TPR) repeat protein